MTIWNLLFYEDLVASSKMKLICVPSHYYWSIEFSALNSFFFSTFSHVCLIYVAGVLIIHFCRYCHLRFLSPYEYQSEVNFWGSTSDPDPSLVLFISILLALHLHKPYFLLFKC